MLSDDEWFLVDSAAYGMAAALKYPLRFCFSFWEAMWTI